MDWRRKGKAIAGKVKAFITLAALMDKGDHFVLGYTIVCRNHSRYGDKPSTCYVHSRAQ